MFLETERLHLRQLTVEDAPFILELLNEPSYIQNIGDRGVRTLDDARAYLRDVPLASYAKNGFGLLMVELKASGESLGMCGLIKRDTLPDVDIGFAFFPRYWGQGYAFEAAAAVMTYGREVMRLERIVGIVSPGNTGSINVLRKLGLRFERLFPWPGDGSEVELYG
jgi:RimJ/RimL family protein N-acetyltransferase